MEVETKRNPLELFIEIVIGAIVVIGYIVYHAVVFVLNMILILLPLVVIIIGSVFIAIFILIKTGVL